MKIHYLVTTLELGGAALAIPGIINVMRKTGHDVTVTVCEPRDMGAAPALDKAGISYHLLFDKRKSKLTTLRAFLPLIHKNRPDVIWASLSAAGLIGMLAGLITGIPVVTWKHSASIRVHTRLTRGLSSLWVADSRSVAEFMTGKMRMSKDRVMTWPLFEPLTLKNPPPTWDGAGTLQIGSIGRLHPVKNYDLLILAVANLCKIHPEIGKRVHLTIVGEGKQRKSLEKLIARHNLQDQVSLPGMFPRVQPFLETWHLYAQPSRYEGMCLAGHEAMAVGLPIIATPVGELTDSINNSGGGILLDQSDITGSIASAIENAFKQPETLAQMGEAGKAHINTLYSKEQFERAGMNVLHRVEQFLNEIVTIRRVCKDKTAG